MSNIKTSRLLFRVEDRRCASVYRQYVWADLRGVNHMVTAYNNPLYCGTSECECLTDIETFNKLTHTEPRNVKVQRVERNGREYNMVLDEYREHLSFTNKQTKLEWTLDRWLTQHQIEMLKRDWRAFYENPENYRTQAKVINKYLDEHR